MGVILWVDWKVRRTVRGVRVRDILVRDASQYTALLSITCMYPGLVTIVHRYGCVLRNDQRNNDNQNIGVWMQNGDKIVLLYATLSKLKVAYIHPFLGCTLLHLPSLYICN